MKSIEERIIELEQRVIFLESIIKKSETVDSVIEKSKEENVIRSYQKEWPSKKVAMSYQDQISRGNNKNSENINKNRETIVGKYLVGALASLLVFVGAISFIGLVWNQMTPEMKLALLSLSGIGLTALGFCLIRSKKNPITSIILGTGSGLLFIAILSANLAFHLIGNNTSIILAGIWAIFFILSSRYTHQFFTTIIAYIGSYIALILGLVLIQSDFELLVVVLFATSISIVMIYNVYNNKNSSLNVELITSIVLSTLSYATISLRCFLDGLFVKQNQLLDGYILQTLIIIMIYVLMNMLYKIIDNKVRMPIYLAISFVTTMLTSLYIFKLSVNYLELKAFTCFMLFFAVNAIQLLLSNGLYKGIVNWLTSYYTVVLVIASISINMELYDESTGIIIIALLIAIIEKVLKRDEQSYLIGGIVLLDSLFLLSSSTGHIIFSLYGLLQIGILVYVLWRSFQLHKHDQIVTIKAIGIIVLVMNCFSISTNIVNNMKVEHISTYIGNGVGHLMATVAIIVLLRIGYLKSWKDEQFEFFRRNDEVKNDDVMAMLFYLTTTVLYFIGLNGISSVEEWFLQFIYTMSTIMIALIQSKAILKSEKYRAFSGVWIIVKYLILIWTILGSFFDLNITTVAYSIVGLLVAIGSISVGFKLNNKNLRQYGLVLTIIMVAKFILVDLNQENSILRVLALIAGGGLCFLISVIYNKLNIKTEE